MPQTREHLAILDLLGIERGVVALTKSDLVDDDWLDLVEADVEETLQGTTLAGSPIVRCSATTGAGLEALVGVIEARLRETAAKRDAAAGSGQALGRPRLPIDRVFTVAGFGTVVTGTLIDGALDTGQEVEVLPALVGGHLTSLKSRIRGLQTHRSRVQRALPGTRTAANLAGLEPEALHRGQVVTTPGWLRPSMAVDVRLRVLRSAARPLRHNLNVSFHCFAAETPARLRLLDQDEALPGEEAWAQLRLARPVAVLKGDRFVIRDANDTLGGGTIVETQAKRHPRRRQTVIAGLERQQSGGPTEALYAAIAAGEPLELSAAVARSDLDAAAARSALEALANEERIVLLGEGEGRLALTAPGFDKLRRLTQDALAFFLKDHPLRRGIGKEELRSRLGLQARAFAPVLEALAREGAVADLGSSVSPPEWSPRLTPAQQRAADAYLAALRAEPYAPPTDQRPPEELLTYLIESGSVVDVGGGVVFAADAYERMVGMVVAALERNGTITMAEARDLFGSSRRYIQPFLEHLDSQRITVRRGDERLLRRPL